jgi:predicted O-linked N-acetylglucosamine transferase (SPINDLY family)
MQALREIGDMGLAAQAQAIRDDRIDVLVDLNGFTSNPLMPLFMQRPAPLQMNFLGYTGTMGNAAYDLIVTDHACVTDADRPYFTEAPMYVDPCYLPSDPRREWGSDVTPPSRAEQGLPADAIVLAAFGGAYKITAPMFDTWMRVLSQVPGSVLWLRAGDPQIAVNLRAEAQRRGVDPQRLVFAPTVALPMYFARWRLVDVMLDTFPFGAHTTVNDALFAGVPVVTIAGRSFASRASASQLRALNMPDAVATSMADYEARVVALATDAALRDAWKARVRAQVASAPLFDMPRYAAAFAAALEAEWNRRVSAAASAPAAGR